MKKKILIALFACFVIITAVSMMSCNENSNLEDTKDDISTEISSESDFETGEIISQENDNEENEFIVALPANKEEHWGEASVIIK